MCVRACVRAATPQCPLRRERAATSVCARAPMGAQAGQGRHFPAHARTRTDSRVHPRATRIDRGSLPHVSQAGAVSDDSVRVLGLCMAAPTLGLLCGTVGVALLCGTVVQQELLRARDPLNVVSVSFAGDSTDGCVLHCLTRAERRCCGGSDLRERRDMAGMSCKSGRATRAGPESGGYGVGGWG